MEFDKKIEEIKEKAISNFVPIIQGESLRLMEVLLDMKRPEKILEIGTAVGYSASIFSKYLSNSASSILTIERDENRYKEAVSNIQELKLNDKIKIVQADAKEYLQTLNESFDVIFIDAAKGQYMFFLEQAKRLIKNGGVIIADNVLFKGRVLGEYNEHKYRTAVTRLREYIETINEDKELNSVVLDIGDGIAISVVNKEKS